MSAALLSRPTRPRASASRARLAAVGAGALALSVLLAGCAGSDGSSSGASSAQPPVGGVAAAAPGAAPRAGTTDSASGTDSLGVPLAAVSDRSIVVRADVAVRVDDVLKATAALGGIATTHAATIASQSSSSGSSTPVDTPTAADGTPVCPSTGCPTSYASSTTTLRLDNSGVDALLADVAKLGTVEASTRTSDDVTADVADVDARVRNAEASLARVRALMSRATRIGDVVALEGEMSKRQSDLEALEARQRTLADQTAQATVTVRLLGSGAPAPTPNESTGFLAGLHAGWDAFTGFMAGTLTVLGAIIPFLLLIVPVALLAWLVVRRRRAPHAVPEPEPGV